MRSKRFGSLISWMIGAYAVVALPAVAGDGRGLSFPDIVVQPAELSTTYLRTGQDQPLQNLRSVTPGSPMEEVIGLLGQPYQRTIQGETRYWDYNVNFPIANDDSLLVCQYKVVIGGDGKVASTHWRRHTCEGMYQAAIAALPEQKVEVLTLSADVLFAFDEHELTAEGRQSLNRVAQQLGASYQNPVITLVGHTDRIGPSDYNMTLSRQRADAVRHYFTELGLPSASMVAEGRGDTEPVVFCQEAGSSELVKCLQPNRRVDIEVFERLEQPHRM
ncbi:OmpA family protein [Halomonas mongoliensis]|uniref:OmpA family protein n=1 Tax=Halomonas mongoliensis TaxID=321265 RepID=A0ABU1GKJ3_9GAMM|nr:OmpA family protein [Halomonas mongoliensis]MDR5892479.1 OmpA family protein [Halomonas mongoliensis]